MCGWSGAGYIITDPVTGEGAYKIGGGGNGGLRKIDVDQHWKHMGGIADANLRGLLSKIKSLGKLGVIFKKIVVGALFNILSLSVTGDISQRTKDVINKPCLTESQSFGLLSAIKTIGHLDFLAFSPAGGGVGSIAQILGFSVIVSSMVHFVNMNKALGDC